MEIPLMNIKQYSPSSIQEFISYLDCKVEHFGRLYEQYNDPEFLKEMQDAQHHLTLIYREYPMERILEDDEE